ncbi:MAG: hypothetical protein LDL12_00210 [Anaerolinea sp.]|nr:hypothetical protein [Anaerolinea sp.]
MLSSSYAPKPYQLTDEQKSASFMAYTTTALYWGEVVVRNSIRVSTWLRTNAAPETITIYNAKVINITANGTPNPMKFTEVHVPNASILAYHLIPPDKDPLDYDPTEPHRVMDPVTAIIGTFRIDGKMRMSTRSTLKKYIEVTRELFTTLYDAEISNPVMPALTKMKVDMVMVRQATCVFCLVNPQRPPEE